MDITGEPPAAYLDALVQGAVDGFTATVRTNDEHLPKWLLDSSAKVFVALPAEDDGWAVIAEQEKGIVTVRCREKSSEEKTWEAKTERVVLSTRYT